MKNLKRSFRRYKSKCKLEKRINIWVKKGDNFFLNEKMTFNIGGDNLIYIRNEIRKGNLWTFLKTSSTPCSCSLCRNKKYKRLSKSELKKIIENGR